MNDNRIKSAIDTRLASMEYSRSFSPCARETQRFVRYRLPIKRMVAMVAVFCCVATLSLGVMAAAVPQISNLFSLVGEQISSFLQPLHAVSTSNGIRMELQAAMHDEETVVIYLTMHDEYGGRLSADMELYDLEVSDMFFPSCQVINYDEASNTATLCITGTGHEAQNGQKLSLSFSTILTGRSYESEVDLNLSVAELAAANTDAELFYPDITETQYMGEETELAKQVKDGKTGSLKPEVFTMPIKDYTWSYFSGVGIVNNALHLQQNPDDDMGLVSELTPYLALADGQRLEAPAIRTGFGKCTETGFHRTTDYKENIFELPTDVAPEDIKLMAEVQSYGQKLTGKWNADFALGEASVQKSADCILNMNPWEITEVRVSPIGVTLIGHGQMYEYSSSPEIRAVRVDGTEISFCTGSSSSDYRDGKESIVIKSIFSAPIATEELASLSVNGVNILLE